MILFALLLLSLPKQTQQKVEPKPPVFIDNTIHVSPHINLYSDDGSIVATCKLDDDGHPTDCKIIQGYTLNDVMGAWLHAYEEMEK